MKRVLDLAYWLQRRLWKWLRPRTRGVKVMLVNPAGEILLIRNSYGDRNLFVLPGGGIRPWEAPERAAAREVKEELGVAVTKLALVSTHVSGAEGKRDTIYVYKAEAVGDPNADSWEVAECRYFAFAALPAKASPATLRRIDEYLGKRPADGRW